MGNRRRATLPVAALLRVYAESASACADPQGARFVAIRSAGEWLRDDALDAIPADEFYERLVSFYEAVASPALHSANVGRRAALIRHGLSHLLRCPDPLPVKLARCLVDNGPYFVTGLGPSFWSAAAQVLDPLHHPTWTRQTIAGLTRLGLFGRNVVGPAATYAALLAVYRRLQDREPTLTALQIDHFVSLVAHMDGRELGTGDEVIDPLPALVRRERSRTPLRRLLKERGAALAAARSDLATGLKSNDPDRVAAALRVADPMRRRPIDWDLHGPILLPRIDRLFHADRPLEELPKCDRQAELCGAGRWLTAAVLHLRSPHEFPPWEQDAHRGLARIDDALGEDYRTFAEAVVAACARYRMHPLEAPAVLASLSESVGPSPVESTGFAGFCRDTFTFLNALVANNRRDWMESQRHRYRFVVREPLAELCVALAERYVEPVLRSGQGWDIETSARSGGALSRIVKNDYGRSVPYHDVLWITFARRDRGKRRDAQLFVRLSSAAFSYGLRLGLEARAVREQFRGQVECHADALFSALRAAGALDHCRFGQRDDLSDAITLQSADDLRRWSAGKTPVVARTLDPDDPLLRGEDLVGDIILTFDRLMPAYACAVADDPSAFLARRACRKTDGIGSRQQFHRATYLSDAWLGRALSLLEMKPQLVLHGVPGTGKTHVARELARMLTGGREDAIRLVQFHPAYGYEEFVEGIRVRTVDIDGRHEITYPVENGLLTAFAAEAERRPDEPFVLIIDEINRGNLPRIFGELLYLLEYRQQAVTLPYSRREFRLPANLYVLATMNAADRSVAGLDQALRRRFSFLEMLPDAAVLSAWLTEHPPRGDEDFAASVLRQFEELNTRIAAEVGPHRRVGHSYFMVCDLDADQLRAVWDHHVKPLLADALGDRRGGYGLDELLHGRKSRRAAKSIA
jgi:hypothetical protein